VAIIKEKFIPVGVDADMLNVVEDVDGKFVKDSGMRLSGSSGGVVFVTANGKLLGQTHLHGTNRAGIDEALAAWDKLPESERRPGAIKFGGRGPIDSKHATAEPPAKGLILKVHGRYLAHEASGGLRTTSLLKDFPGIKQPATAHPGHFEFYSEANPDYMWLTEAEWKSLIPANPTKGDRYPLPGAIIDRLCWYHLLPNALNSRIGHTWGAVGPPEKKGIRARELTLTVEEVTEASIRLSLEGFVHLGNAHDPDAGSPKTHKDVINFLGYEARLRGRLTYDTTRKVFTRFEMVALGDMYGDSAEGNWLFRPGRNPVGFAFELIRGSTAAERLPPRGYMTRTDLEGYLGTRNVKQP
jgi:hypothetical protein